MGGLLERLEARKAAPKPCVVGRALAAMPEKDRADMLAALADRHRYSAAVLLEEFHETYGCSFSISMLRIHRRGGECGCG